MSKLSDEIIIRGKKIKNRIVMPPMFCFTFTGDNGGMYGEQYVEHYTKRARGGTGLIIVQATSVVGAAKQIGVWSDKQMKPLEKIAHNCHLYHSTVMMQLSCGDIDINELTIEQIHMIQEDCIAAAARAKQAGFDGSEYHFAHGYTLCRFLDPIFNKRTDSYGGALENRVRFLTEIMPQVREAVGEEFIVSVRMGGNIPDVTGAIDIAKAFEEAGIDLLHISFGMQEPVNVIPADFKCSTIAFNGSEIKKHVKIPVIAVSEIFTGEQAKFLIENEYADFAAIGRGIYADENWANKVLADEPIQQCRNCGGSSRKCLWFVDHTKCPAKKISGGITRKKIIVLNGSPRKQGTTFALAEAVSKAAADQGAEIKSYYLNGMNIKGCQSCHACKGEEHRCILQDDMQELYDEIDSASGIVFATPVYMWQMTAQLKQVIDRLYPFLKPDYSSYLAPDKKILLAVTQGRPDTSMFHHYFEHMGENLSFLGFGAYKILIAGGTSGPEDLYTQTEVLAEARRMGEWLAE